MSLSMRDMELSEVMAMLSRQRQVNILLANGVNANVSFNLYDVSLDDAIESIARVAGYAVEKSNGKYFIVAHDSAGKYAPNGLTQVRSFEVQYADPGVLAEMLSPYLSGYGALNVLEDRRLLIIEDTPEFVDRMARLMAEIDRKPRQILIEAQILEITLDDDDAFGIDWKNLFTSDGGSGSFGTGGLATGEGNGFFFNLATNDIEVALDALRSSGRVRTLSTPKLLALENQESEVLIGDRKGYRVTTTINQVTSESIEFLESGVILQVTPSIDSNGSVMLDIHPEVSTGTVDASGVPSQTTTEVTTRLLVSDGHSVFIGGLLKHTLTESRTGVPVLGDIPGVKRLFSNRRKTNTNTETIVLITPHVVDDDLNQPWNTEPRKVIDNTQLVLGREVNRIGQHVTDEFPSLNRPDSDPPLELTLSPSLSQHRSP
ncbi:MAG: hypothetical protein HKM98_09435 [Gammaproteobacteria bacterium]|nr:hypothetical protein [Gammaproteobacteria bacterium]